MTRGEKATLKIIEQRYKNQQEPSASEWSKPTEWEANFLNHAGEIFKVLEGARTTLNRCVTEEMTHKLSCLCAEVAGDIERVIDKLPKEQP